MSSSNHYSLAHKPFALQDWANTAATALHARVGRHHPILIYRGMSGVATATALAIAYVQKFGKDSISMCYVRKPTEKSHGENVEFRIAKKGRSQRYVFVFVDDFVSSGDTRTAVFKAAKEALNLPGVNKTKFIEACSGGYHDPDDPSMPQWWMFRDCYQLKELFPKRKYVRDSNGKFVSANRKSARWQHFDELAGLNIQKKPDSKNQFATANGATANGATANEATANGARVIAIEDVKNIRLLASAPLHPFGITMERAASSQTKSYLREVAEYSARVNSKTVPTIEDPYEEYSFENR